MKGRSPFFIGLRHSWGILAVLPVLVLEFLNVTDRASTSFDHWPTALDSVNGVLLVVNPLVSGIVCAETLLLTRRSQRESTQVLPDGGLRLLVNRAMATATPIILIHLIVILFVFTQSNTNGLNIFPTLLPVVPAVLSIIAYSAIGLALGCLFPYLVVPPLASVGLYLLALTIMRNLPDPLVEFGGASGVMLGVRNRPDVLIGQSLWLVALAAVFIVLALVNAKGYAKLWPRVLGGAVVVMAFGVGLGSLGDLRFESRPVNFSCTGHDPQVCVAAIYADQLDSEAARVRAVVHEVENLSVDLPERFEQGTSARAESKPNVGYFNLAGPESESPYDNLVLSIIQSVACTTDERPQVDQVQIVIGWLRAATEDEKTRLQPGAEDAMNEISSCD